MLKSGEKKKFDRGAKPRFVHFKFFDNRPLMPFIGGFWTPEYLTEAYMRENPSGYKIWKTMRDLDQRWRVGGGCKEIPRTQFVFDFRNENNLYRQHAFFETFRNQFQRSALSPVLHSAEVKLVLNGRGQVSINIRSFQRSESPSSWLSFTCPNNVNRWFSEGPQDFLYRICHNTSLTLLINNPDVAVWNQQPVARPNPYMGFFRRMDSMSVDLSGLDLQSQIFGWELLLGNPEQQPIEKLEVIIHEDLIEVLYFHILTSYSEVYSHVENRRIGYKKEKVRIWFTHYMERGACSVRRDLRCHSRFPQGEVSRIFARIN